MDILAAKLQSFLFVAKSHLGAVRNGSWGEVVVICQKSIHAKNRREVCLVTGAMLMKVDSQIHQKC